MSKLRSVLVGTALAGALAAGIAAAPAQAATATTASAASTASASQAQYTKHWFSGYSSFGRGESRGDRSEYKGYWYYSGGRYYFDIEARDHDRDRQNTYIDFSWHDDNGWHNRRFSTGGQERVEVQLQPQQRLRRLPHPHRRGQLPRLRLGQLLPPLLLNRPAVSLRPR